MATLESAGLVPSPIVLGDVVGRVDHVRSHFDPEYSWQTFRGFARAAEVPSINGNLGPHGNVTYWLKALYVTIRDLRIDVVSWNIVRDGDELHISATLANPGALLVFADVDGEAYANGQSLMKKLEHSVILHVPAHLEPQTIVTIQGIKGDVRVVPDPH